MQFDEKVLTALEVLTDAAENDFELFRICTLVRDLIAPPVAEQVDDTHQRFNGVTYKQVKSGHYQCSKSIHVDVWRYYNGDIPEGYEIHHDNDNPADNSATNFICLTKSEHQKLHRVSNTGIFTIKIFVCQYCGKEYPAKSTGRNRFCSMKCFRAAHKKSRTCLKCGKVFLAKNSSRKFCSRECASKYKTVKKCPVCGKNFEGFATKKYCSKACSMRAFHNNHSTPNNRKGFDES